MVQLIQEGEEIPFDVAETRTIFVDHRDLDSVAACKEELRKQIIAVEKDPRLVDTPLSVVVDLQSSRGGENPQEKILLQLVDRVSEISFRLRRIERNQDLFELIESSEKGRILNEARILDEETTARRNDDRARLETIARARRLEAENRLRARAIIRKRAGPDGGDEVPDKGPGEKT